MLNFMDEIDESFPDERVSTQDLSLYLLDLPTFCQLILFRRNCLSNRESDSSKRCRNFSRMNLIFFGFVWME